MSAYPILAIRLGLEIIEKHSKSPTLLRVTEAGSYLCVWPDDGVHPVRNEVAEEDLPRMHELGWSWNNYDGWNYPINT